MSGIYSDLYRRLNLFFYSFKSACKRQTRWKSNVMNINDISKIRNIGIIAHIDAGKTTTTERMLYYSGLIPLMGEVHDGNTVTDYMHLERERGITITSAAVTFPWKNFKINLIDTPGHVDFTFEVERSLAVLDGAVTIIDSSEGVEVQTLNVWNQAIRYEVPSIVYLNKMDKPSANIDMCLTSLSNKLKIEPLVLHEPIGIGKEFTGVFDIVHFNKIVWNNTSPNNDGCKYSVEKLPTADEELILELSHKREKLIEAIANLDDLFAEKYVCNGIKSLSISDFISAIRRVTLSRNGVPVLCGSSYKNIGVQLLMDAVLNYLPSPTEKQCFLPSSKSLELLAFVFKIIFTKNKEPLTYLRIYSGSLKSGQRIYSINRNNTEKIDKLMIALADDFKEVSSAASGDIVVASGIRHAITGDIFSSSVTDTHTALNLNGDLSSFIQVPSPVFFCTIEPFSAGLQKRLDFALQCLQREDPTFQVETDESLGQTIIKGMGELHIDVIKNRIKSEYGVDAYLGFLQVAYRETLNSIVDHTHILDKSLGSSKHFVKITLKLYPSLSNELFRSVNVVVTKENGLGKVDKNHLKAVNDGAKTALNNGPIIDFPVINVIIDLMWLEVSKGTSYSMISAATTQCILCALKKAKVALLEPVMNLNIIVKKGFAGRVLNDLCQKRSQIISMESRQDVEIILSKTPLSELRGFSTHLRAITSGACSFTLEFDSYQKMDPQQQIKAIQEVTGFAPI